jgi:hypothetical protein
MMCGAVRNNFVLLPTLFRSQRTNRSRANQRRAGVNDEFILALVFRDFRFVLLRLLQESVANRAAERVATQTADSCVADQMKVANA